jgi:hypothetical protein
MASRQPMVDPAVFKTIQEKIDKDREFHDVRVTLHDEDM